MTRHAREALTLADIADLVSVRDADRGVRITSLSLDSRKAGPGSLFAALPGSKVDGLQFARGAVQNGAVAVLCDEASADAAPADAAVVSSANPRRALALVAGRFYRQRPRDIVAVTGTNGKTSVAAFTQQLWAAAGIRAATIGTLGITHPDGSVTPSLTTPDTITLHESLAELADAGVDAVALEASSHGLAQHRLDGLSLKAAAFTNLTRDHLDYHQSMEAYRAAKMRIFDLLEPSARAVVDADGEGASTVLGELRERRVPHISTGRNGRDIVLEDTRVADLSQVLKVRAFDESFELDLPLAGAFQASNALVAAGLAITSGVPVNTALQAIEALKGAPGRLELVGTVPSGGRVFVDYSHTPASLTTALATLRPYSSGRLIVLGGAGGDRDPGKRPLMGEAMAKGADMVIVTDDNPRSEDPAEIRRAILEGCPDAAEIADRGAAIAEGVRMLGAGDVLLVAGKGHETGQTIGDVTLPFSDHEAVRAAVAALSKRETP